MLTTRISRWMCGGGGLAAVLAAAVVGNGCSLMAPRYQKPEVTVAAVEWVGGNILQQNFLVKLKIQNPNDRALPVTGLHAELNVGGERWASGVSTQPFVVPAEGSTQFDMTVTANLGLALLKLSQRTNPGSVIDYDMTGAAKVDLPFLHELPFHQSGSLSLGAR